MSEFWRKWMVAWCWFTATFGLALAGAGFEATSGPARLMYAALGWPGELAFDAPLRFAVALLGAVTLGWSITLLAVVQAACRLGERGQPVWQMLALSVGAWYVIDSALSIATGFALNAVTNTLLAGAFLVPIIQSGVLRGNAGSGTSGNVAAKA